ncbi:MAG: hypothetical protein N2662_01495 [Bacteroidales bacterium]|nr:hypothetical protein [Bacteroidales bacterium]
MYTSKRLFSNLAVLLYATLSIPTFAQYTMNSPYSRFGIGDMEFQGFTQNRSMGGSGISLRMPNQINILNPAAATAQDSLSFVWDVGMKGMFTKYRTSSQEVSQKNFNFDHLAFSAAVSNRLAFGAGLVPYSKTGYYYKETFTFPDNERLGIEYTGNGNINRFYLGVGYAFFNKRLSIGYQLSFLFGSITNYTYSAMINSSGKYYGYYSQNYTDFSATGLIHTFGIQGVWPVSSQNSIVVGFVYEPTSRLSSDKKIVIRRGNDTLSFTGDTGYFKIPDRIGIGLGMIMADKLNVGIDYVMQDWSKATIFNRSDSLRQYYRLSIGAEYVYDKYSYTSYWAKVRFRLGAHYENTYLSLYQQGIKDYGVSFGMAFPMRRANTFFHVGFEVGRRGTTSHNLIEDNYKRVFLSLSLYDFWFFKRKYD